MILNFLDFLDLNRNFWILIESGRQSYINVYRSTVVNVFSYVGCHTGQ